MKEVFEKPYVYWVSGIFILYIVLAVFLSGFYSTIQYIPYYLNQLHWLEFGLSVFFTLVIGLLVGVNAVVGYLKFQEHKKLKNVSSLSCAATALGLTTGVCPACVTGIFPLILTSLGITFSWASLPFKGLEIQALTIVILILSLYLLKRKK